MSFQPGERLGAYEVLSTLGAGGMGVVYRARDTRLGRDVAIKTLPDDVAADTERRNRFEREARALAALSHPNVASIFGFEQAGSAHLLVMELVEGETLADWIARGPLPVERALPLFLQIAAGIEAAHAKGIIHRDLKPANIKIAGSPSSSSSSREIKPGTVKILDFGLAKALAPDSEARAIVANATHSPTLTLQATMRGELLGTAGYMAPEQAEGEPADQRADIWAFGVCLLEALTGRPVFGGSNASRILASVLKDQPDLTTLPATTPPAVRRLLRRCLEKDRDKRLRDIGDARLDLEEAIAASATETAAPVVLSRRAPRSWIAVAAGAVLVAAAGGVFVGRYLRANGAPSPAARFVLNPPPNAMGSESANNEVAITADGKTIVYVARPNPEQMLFARQIDQLDGAPIPGVEPIASNPVLSPDGRWLGYIHQAAAGAPGTLRKVALAGGPSVELANAGAVTGTAWGPGDVIVFGQVEGPLRHISAAGGEAQDLTELREGELAHRYPMFLPAGRAVLFTTVTGGRAGVAGNTISDSTTVEAVTLATGERKVLVRDASQPSYVGSGHLLYAVGSTLYAVAFDPERLELRGDAVPVQENVARSSNSAAKYAVSASGALAFVHGGGSTGNVLVWVDREGREEPLGAPPRQYFYPRLSPDGTRIAVDVRAEKQEIWIWDIEREASTRLTGSEGQPTYSVWSPDGRKVFHSTSLPSGDWAIVARNADGSGDPFTVIEEPRFILPSAITADGKGLLATRGFSGAAAPPFDIVLIDPAVKAEPKVLLHRAGSFFTAPALSPDGRFVAYVSDESGTAEVFVRPYPALDSHRWQVSSGGGRMPYWSRDGREIFFVDGREHLAAASVTMRDGTLSIGRAEVLLHTAFLSSFGRSYDVTPDGKRFLMIKGAAAGDEPNGRVVYVQNWLHELRRLAPPRR